MTTKSRNWLIAILIVTFPFALFFGFLIFMEEPLPPIAPLPNPNGYDDLVKAGQLLSTNDDYYKTNKADLIKLVEDNVEGVSLARKGLSEKCQVAVQFNSAYAEKHFDDLVGMKRLMTTLIDEGTLAEMDNRPNDAIKTYLDVVHLGNESARGGVLIDQLVGTGIENVGIGCLQKLVGRLDAKTCRETAATLETLDVQRQTWNEVIEQENAWSRRTFRGLRYRLSLLVSGRSIKQDQEKAEQHFINQQIKTRQLITTLGSRAYELDKGHRPASAADLVPDYLKAIPQDPVTGTNLMLQ